MPPRRRSNVYFVLPKPGNYSAVIEYKGKKYLYDGITSNLNKRFQTHRHTKAGDFFPPKFSENPSPRFKEVCFRRYYGLSHQIVIPEGVIHRAIHPLNSQTQSCLTNVQKELQQLSKPLAREMLIRLLAKYDESNAC